MKIRRGFVSNSSTTSFCIYGGGFDAGDDLIQKACGILKIECDVESENFDSYEIGEQISEKSGLEFHSGPEGEGMYFGKSLAKMNDDETYGAFKKSIEEKLAEVFGEKIECGVIEEAWRDG